MPPLSTFQLSRFWVLGHPAKCAHPSCLISRVQSIVRCIILLTTDRSVGKNPLCRRGLHISSCQPCLRMGTNETCFGKILTASRAPLTRWEVSALICIAVSIAAFG